LRVENVSEKFFWAEMEFCKIDPWIPSSFRFFSICLDRALEARSSADMAHPILLMRRAATLDAELSHGHLLHVLIRQQAQQTCLGSI
jgi:hypothetical protein